MSKKLKKVDVMEANVSDLSANEIGALVEQWMLEKGTIEYKAFRRWKTWFALLWFTIGFCAGVFITRVMTL